MKWLPAISSDSISDNFDLFMDDNLESGSNTHILALPLMYNEINEIIFSCDYLSGIQYTPAILISLLPFSPSNAMHTV